MTDLPDAQGVDDNYQVLPGFFPAWVYVSAHADMTPELIDRLQGHAAELMLLHQRGEADALTKKILTSAMPINVIVCLVGVARALGEAAHGREHFAEILANWKPGDTFEHEHEWRGKDANP